MQNWKQTIAVAIASVVLLGGAAAQDPPQNPSVRQQGEGAGQRRGVMRMSGTGGTISAISGDTLTLKTFNGQDATVKISDKTQFRKDQKEAKASDFKAGDLIVVRGDQNPDGSWAAHTVVSRSDMAQFAGRGQDGGKRTFVMGGSDATAGGNLQQMFEQAWAKQFVVGHVKSIDGTRLTIEGPMNHSATIEVDENTSFRKDGSSATAESITLADIKPGSNVFGCGAVNKDGVFVPTVLTVADQNMGIVGGLAGCPNMRPPQAPQK
jgi:hypothetical protein